MEKAFLCPFLPFLCCFKCFKCHLANFCSIRILLVLNTVVFLLLNVLIVSIVNTATTASTLSDKNLEKDLVILKHVERVSHDFLNHIFHLPLAYRTRLELYPGTFDMLDHNFMQYTSEVAYSLLEQMTYSTVLRLSMADMQGNVYIFDHKSYRTPYKVELWLGNSTEYLHDSSGSVISTNSSIENYGPLWKIPLDFNQTTQKAFLRFDLFSERKSSFKVGKLAWYKAGISTTSLDERITVESLCVCTFVYLFTACRHEDSSGNQIAVVGSALAVVEIGTFLDELELDNQIVVLINKQTHHIMASNRKELIEITYKDETDTLTLYRADESNFVDLAKVYGSILKETYDYRLEVNDVFSVGKALNGYIVNARSFGVNNMEFVAITMIKSGRVYAVTYLLSGISAFVGFFLFVVASCFSICLGCCFTWPLTRLIRKMKKVQKMDLDVKIGRSSVILEVRSVQKALKFLIKKLRLYRAFLPEDILLQEEKKYNRSFSNQSEKDIEKQELLGNSKEDEFEIDGMKVNAAPILMVGAPSTMISQTTNEDDESEDAPNDTTSLSGSSAQSDCSGSSSVVSFDDRRLRRNMSQLSTTDERFGLGIKSFRTITVASVKLKINRGSDELSGSALKIGLSKRQSIKKYSLTGSLIGNVSVIVKKYRGWISEFNEDLEFEVCWNVHKLMNNHIVPACMFAIALCKSLPKFVRKMKVQGLIDSDDKISVCIGLASGGAHFGTIGTESRKKRSFGGPAFESARLLRAYSGGVNQGGVFPIVLEGNMTQYLDSSNKRSDYKFIYYPCDVFVSSLRNLSSFSKSVVFCIDPSVEQASNQEWMYTQPLAERLKRCKKLEDVFEVITVHNNPIDALELLQSTDDHGDDGKVFKETRDRVRNILSGGNKYNNIQEESEGEEEEESEGEEGETKRMKKNLISTIVSQENDGEMQKSSSRESLLVQKPSTNDKDIELEDSYTKKEMEIASDDEYVHGYKEKMMAEEEEEEEKKEKRKKKKSILFVGKYEGVDKLIQKKLRRKRENDIGLFMVRDLFV